MKEFTFNYFAATNVVAFDDFTVKIKMGPFVKKEFPLANLQSFYVFDNNSYRSIFLIYSTDDGKNKKVQVFATPAEMGFTQLVAELTARFPSKSLNHLSEKEAFAAMKVANPKKWAPFAAFFIMMAVLCGIMYPGLRHYLDFGFTTATVNQVASGTDLDSRNVEIRGTLLDAGYEETTTTTHNGSTTTTTKVYVPIVGDDYQAGDKIKVVLEFDALSDGEYNDILNEKKFTGVIRNIAWEGISSKQMNFLITNYHLNMPDAPVLVEITNETHNDGYVIWVVGGIGGFLLILFVIVALKRK
jgi:hypothetical protein